MSFSADVLKPQEQYQHLNMHERCLGLKYKHKRSSYEKLLQLDGSASVHQISKYLQRKRTKSKMIHSLIFQVTYIISHPGSKIWDIFLVSIRNQIC